MASIFLVRAYCARRAEANLPSARTSPDSISMFIAVATLLRVTPAHAVSASSNMLPLQSSPLRRSAGQRLDQIRANEKARRTILRLGLLPSDATQLPSYAPL